MEEHYPHLSIRREEVVNTKRPGRPHFFRPPEDVQGHARRIRQSLKQAEEAAAESIGGFDERRILSFHVGEGLNADDIRKLAPGIELVSQEGKTLVVGFATDEALAEFEARLTTLAAGEKPVNRQVFYALQSMTAWSAEDRKGPSLRREGFPAQDHFMLDVELFPLETRDSTAMQTAFGAWLSEQGIEQLDAVRRPELSLYRLRCNRGQAELLLRYRDARVVDLPPRFGLQRELVFQRVDQVQIGAPAAHAPVIAVLDSGLNEGHPILKPAVVETKSFLPGSGPQDDHGHGTHVAGLALYGDFETALREKRFVPQLRLLSGRVLDAQGKNGTALVENQIERAVRYFAEEHHCTVFNLSFGDSRKPYTGRHLRSLSIMLDALSRELGVLFVVSAGNHQIGANSPQGIAWRDEYPTYLLRPGWELIEPAPALNVLTVGSIARHDQTWSAQRHPNTVGQIPIAKPGELSPFTRGGGSVEGAIKPELLAHGGNCSLATLGGFRLQEGNDGLGVVSAGHAFATGHPFVLMKGTSMAAPQVAHLAARLLEEEEISSNNLLRALLCLHASIPAGTQDQIESEKQLREWAGYGSVDPRGLLRSSQQLVTLLTESRIENKKHHFYELPVPADFTRGGKRQLRELRVALAYTPPVRSTRVKYRATRIQFRVVLAPRLETVTKMFNAATEKKGYKSIPELTGAKCGAQRRSRGTVQADTWQFKQFNRGSKMRRNRLFVVVTRNDHPWGEALCADEESYALVVNLRDAENENARLYTRLRAQLQQRQRVRLQS